MDGNGGCCIASWVDGGHVSKMDKIMLKFRPIAPKPVSGTGSPGAVSDDNHTSPRGGRHAKTAARGSRKSNYNNSKRCNNNGKKRKSSSPDNQIVAVDQDPKGGATLLPLFPEAPDLGLTKQPNNEPIWLNFDNKSNNYYNNNNNCGIMPMFEYNNNYRNCDVKGW